jgi:hypothetical protein
MQYKTIGKRNGDHFAQRVTSYGNLDPLPTLRGNLVPQL